MLGYIWTSFTIVLLFIGTWLLHHFLRYLASFLDPQCDLVPILGLLLLPFQLKFENLWDRYGVSELFSDSLEQTLNKSNFSALAKHFCWWFVVTFGHFFAPLYFHLFLDVRFETYLGLGEFWNSISTSLILVGVWSAVSVSLLVCDENMRSYYPFYSHSSRSWLDLIVWEILYITQIFSCEFYYRGFLLTLFKSFGFAGIFMANLPYAFIHFEKPVPEYFLSILVGIALSILALKTNTIWGGVLIHCGGALVNDIAALLTTKRFPETLFIPFWNPRKPH